LHTSILVALVGTCSVGLSVTVVSIGRRGAAHLLLIGFRGVTTAATQHHISSVQRRTAVLKFMDMIAEDPALLAPALLATTAALLDHISDEGAPLRRKVERVGQFGRNRDRMLVQDQQVCFQVLHVRSRLGTATIGIQGGTRR
jgi:hypothetical protein